MLVSFIFSIAIGLSAALMFILESVVGKQLLPSAGGGPMIWNTCLVFFQVALFVGYLSVALITKYFSFLTQALIVIALFALTLCGPTFLNSGIPIFQGTLEAAHNPVQDIMLWLMQAVAIPFIALAFVSPLLQVWISRFSNYKMVEPYRLYAVSNAGSLLGLLSYPLIVERQFAISEQKILLHICVALVTVAIILSAIFSKYRGQNTKIESLQNQKNEPVTPLRACIPRWIILSALPSSLLLSVTNYILTDVSGIPLFWTIPLLLYLMTYIVAFQMLEKLNLSVMRRIAAFLTLLTLFTILIEVNSPAYLILPLHCACFASCSLYCHGLLANCRPAKQQLAQFYLWIGLGGAVGGITTLLLCPLIFYTNFEYQLALLAVLFFVAPTAKTFFSRTDFQPAIIILTLFLLGHYIGTGFLSEKYISVALLITFLPPAVIALSQISQPRKYALSLVGLTLAATLTPSHFGSVLAQYRNFYGLTRVTQKDGFHRIVHGATIHGTQHVGARDRCEPTSYFHPTGPAGDILLSSKAEARSVAVIGLGVGTLACYSLPNDNWDFLELNPAMEKIAKNEQLFTFLKNAASPNISIHLGDGRQLLAKRLTEKYNFIVIDAFSSDSIPYHLLTHEAFVLYLSRLKAGGKILVHISNRYFDLRRVLRELPSALPVSVFVRDDLGITSSLKALGKLPSTWILVGADSEAPPSIEWKKLAPVGNRLWTDDFSDPLAAL